MLLSTFIGASEYPSVLINKRRNTVALATFGKMNMIEIYAINASALSQFMYQYVRKEHARADRSFYFASKHCRVKKKKITFAK